LSGIKLSCIRGDRAAASPIAVVIPGVGVGIEDEDRERYENARKAQDAEFGETFRRACIEPKLEPEDLGTFLQPQWHTRQGFWDSMKDLVRFIIKTANCTKPMPAAVMRRLLDRTAECVESLP
jgi:hypothetical protein